MMLKLLLVTLLLAAPARAEPARVVATLSLVGSTEVLGSQAEVRDYMFSCLQRLRPGLPAGSVHWLAPYTDGQDAVYDLVDARPNVDCTARRLGRLRIDPRARTFACRLSIYAVRPD